MGYSIFLTYQFEGKEYNDNISYGYTTPIHCNYIEKIETNNLTNININFLFGDENDLPFLVDSTGITTSGNGYGWSAYKINAIVQIVTGTGYDIKPISSEWRKIDVTNQIENHMSGTSINVNNLINTMFKVSLIDYNNSPKYDLSYLNYPSTLLIDKNKLSFGEEDFFFGNVKTDIKATAYTTDIPVILPLNEYNSTTNPTWDMQSSVLISEIGIYDNDGNLVGIGKLNNPISKDSTISRTLIFGMDF